MSRIQKKWYKDFFVRTGMLNKIEFSSTWAYQFKNITYLIKYDINPIPSPFNRPHPHLMPDRTAVVVSVLPSVPQFCSSFSSSSSNTATTITITITTTTTLFAALYPSLSLENVWVWITLLVVAWYPSLLPFVRLAVSCCRNAFLRVTHSRDHYRQYRCVSSFHVRLPCPHVLYIPPLWSGWHRSGRGRK